MYENYTTIGDIGEYAAIAEFVKRGIRVLKPTIVNLPFDMVIELQGKFYKVQVKTSYFLIKDRKAVEFDLTRTDLKLRKSVRYIPGELDLFFLYCVENNYCGLLPFSEVKGRGTFTIRFEKSCPTQPISTINYAYMYNMDTVLRKLVNPKCVCPLYNTSNYGICYNSTYYDNEYLSNKYLERAKSGDIFVGPIPTSPVER